MGFVGEVTISALGQSHWNTADGTRPALDAQDIMQNGYRIYAPVQLARMHPLIDHRQDPQHNEIVAVGGQVGQDSMVIHPFPRPQPGTHYLVILMPGNDPIAHKYTQRWLIISQVFPIDAHDVVQLQPQIIEQGQVSQQEVTIPLTDLSQQLASCS